MGRFSRLYDKKTGPRGSLRGFWSVTRADDVHDSLLILWAIVKWFGGFALRLAGFVGLPARNVASSDK